MHDKRRRFLLYGESQRVRAWHQLLTLHMAVHLGLKWCSHSYRCALTKM